MPSRNTLERPCATPFGHRHPFEQEGQEGAGLAAQVAPASIEHISETESAVPGEKKRLPANRLSPEIAATSETPSPGNPSGTHRESAVADDFANKPVVVQA